VRAPIGVAVLAACVSGAMAVPLAARPDGIDDAFRKFWDARNPQEASKAADRMERSGIRFDDALARLKAGRPYAKDVPVGAITASRRTADGEFKFVVHVPSDYDPGRRYQVRVFLHGGVMRPDPTPRGNGAIPLEGAPQIYILPSGWLDAPWWNDLQIENIEAILDSVKRTYNVDENRVALAGVSDGATGLYYLAMRDTTPFASFLPLNGYLMVLTSAALNIKTELYPNNLVNKPFFIVNGGNDPLYPIRVVEPYVRHLQRNGVDIQYEPQPNAGHDTRWWPGVKDTFEAFVHEHPRHPLPDKLTWETAEIPRSSRAHWLIVDKLGSREKDASPLPDANQAGNGQLFKHERRSGRIDLVRRGNLVDATTRGVSGFTLLLSPDAFDFAQPVKVIVNGRVAFNGSVEKSVATLLKWAAQDNDRTMLFGAELKIKSD
jgi:enterochelin esterase-like enzyme